MSLRIIYGRSGSGKTYCCLNEIKAAIELGTKKPLVLLVPEQFSFQAERDLVSVLKTGGILKTEVFFLFIIIYSIWEMNMILWVIPPIVKV